MRKFYSFMAMALALALILTGCANKTADDGKASFKFNGYPIENADSLVYWVTLNGNVSAGSADLNSTRFASELEKQTGVKVTYQHPPQGQERDQLNILLVSKNMPDIIEYEWANFPGGATNAIQQRYIINLKNLFETSSPNLTKYLKENPSVDKMMKTDDGKYYAYPFILGDELLQVFNGPIVRQDWLDELGLNTPETLNDWYNMLKAFKEKKGASSPLSYNSALFVSYLNNGNFIGAFDIIRGLYLDGETVKFGAVEPNYKAFLAEFAKWYSEGLIDKNISNIDGGAVSNNILNGKSGATIGYAGSGLGSWVKSAADIPGFKLSAVPYPVMNKGDRAKFGQREFALSSNGAAAITDSCKNPELAARFLDYGYSEKGHNLFNFGIEGESFNVINNYPTYTDVVLNNPNKLSISNAIAQYARASYYGPFVQDKAYIEQFYQLPEQKNALKVWADTDAAKTKLPPVALSPEESSEIANIMNNIDTYIDEYSLAKIMGVNKNDDFASFIEQVNKYGLPRVIEIYQGAYGRYKLR